MGNAGPVAPGASARKKASGYALGDNLFILLTGFCALAINLTLLLAVIILFIGSGSSIQAFGASFLWKNVWSAVPPESYGDVPFVYGTLVTSAIGLLLGVPLSIGIAVFLTELSPGWLRNPLGFLVELLAAVPSVVYGLWGFYVLVPFMRQSAEPAIRSVLGNSAYLATSPSGQGIFTSGVILAIMIIPTVSSLSRDAFRAVPQTQREAALSLGATQWESTRMSVLTYARSGVFGAVILGLGRAIGETMAVTMTIGNSNSIPTSIFGPGQTIASLIANEFTEATPLQRSALLEIGLVLLAISFLVNFVARLLFHRFSGPSAEADL
jgi:phosphate transport system permease protein